jgi:TonB family protein
MMMHAAVRTVAVIFLLGFGAPAQVSLAGGAQNQAASATVYPDTAEGLQRMLQDLFAAIRGGNEEQVMHLLQSFALPNAKAWFTRVFGPEEGERLATQYERQHAPTDSMTRKFYEELARKRTADLRIERLMNDADSRTAAIEKAVLSVMKEPIALYSAQVVEPGTTGGSTLGYFVYVERGFRQLDATTLYALSTAPPFRIRLGGKIAQAQLLNQVRPYYPRAAREQHIQGAVQLQAIITREGAVRELTVVSGHPMLAAAAVEAVREWRYRPTRLNGLPVEVLTTIDVNFVLGR